MDKNAYSEQKENSNEVLDDDTRYDEMWDFVEEDIEVNVDMIVDTKVLIA